MAVESLVRSLVDLYDSASRELEAILGSADSTDFQIGRSDRILRQVEAVVRRLKNGHRDWAREEIARAYADAAEAISREGFAFEVVDVRAVEAVAERLVTDLDRAADSIPRDLRNLFVRTQQEAAPEGLLLRQVGRARILGLSPDDLRRRIAQTLRDGATARLRGVLPSALRERLRAVAEGRYVPIVGKDGVLRRYGLRFYSETVGRTWSMSAANEAALQMAEEFGTDLVQFPVHLRACPICLPWQGKVFSRSGNHPDFPPITAIGGTLPLHPNCRHRWLPVVEEALKRRGQYDRLSALSASKREIESIAQYREMVVR